MREHLIGSRAAVLVACAAALNLGAGLWGAAPARAAAPASAPQVLLAVTNSQSMDGSTSGAIMTGSGQLGTAASSLHNASSPKNFTVPAGFVPPLQAGDGVSAPYTATCASGSGLCDNSPSRLNMAKAAIKQILQGYGETMNFGLYTYATGSPSLYSTWVYYMSPPGGFSFTNTASAATVVNPCFNYRAASSSVASDCGAIASVYTGRGVALDKFQYMNIALSSDDPTVNDVLYAGGGLPSVMLTYGSISPASPFPPNFSLGQYNNGGVSVSYSNGAPASAVRSTWPSNSAYIPYSTEVMNVQRGFGYLSAQSASTGQAMVPMTGSVSAFTNALAPETNSAGSSEMKSLTVQSPIGGLLAGALGYLKTLARVSCQKQYVVLLTDGLPTLDLGGRAWPPLGTLAGNAYGLTASFGAAGDLTGTNDVALTDTIASIKNLAAAGISTYVIGLGAGVNSASNPMAAQTLKAMAVAGGTGDFFPATDAASLNSAFMTIAQYIYNQTSESAPLVPISVQGGNAYAYSLTSNPNPPAGYVNAYALNAAGVPASTASWDAAALMTPASCSAALRSTHADGTVQPLAAIDAAAFALTPTTCVPNVATIVSYLVNPSYANGSCNYLAGRSSGTFLTKFSTQNSARYVGPPSGSATRTDASYAAYVAASKSRRPMLMFTNSDGFLYAVDAASGALRWAWTPRSVLAKTQNYGSYLASTLMDGSFAVVDAKGADGTWGSYVVGSTQSGAEHFSLKLASDGMPQSVVYDTVVVGGNAPGDLAGPTGTTPFRQPPQFFTREGRVFAVYVVVSGASSTLFEVDVATGASSSAALGFTPSSALSVDAPSGRLWVGSTAGAVWATTLTGSAAVDAPKFANLITMVQPVDAKTLVKPILYVGYQEVAGIPYVYAAGASQLSVFGLNGASWKPVFAATPTAGYLYKASSGTFEVSTNVPALTAGSVLSDLPRADGKLLLLPVYRAPPVGVTCATGSGYYDLYDLGTGRFPSTTYTLAGTTISASLAIGTGPAFTPTASLTSRGVGLYTGTAGSLRPSTPAMGQGQGNAVVRPIGWRLLQ